MNINQVGGTLGVGIAALGTWNFTYISAVASVPPSYAMAQPVTPEQVQYWGQVLSPIIMAGGGAFMALWGKVTAKREERLKTSFGAELARLNRDLAELKATADADHSEFMSEVRLIGKSLREMSVLVEAHEKTLDDIAEREKVRARVLKISKPEDGAKS